MNYKEYLNLLNFFPVDLLIGSIVEHEEIFAPYTAFFRYIFQTGEEKFLFLMEAENAMKKFDKRRKGFYNSVTKWEWGNPQYFELCLDSGKLGIDLCIKLLTVHGSMYSLFSLCVDKHPQAVFPVL